MTVAIVHERRKPARSKSPQITWLEVGPRTVYLIARCEGCGLVIERELSDVDDDALLDAIGGELLCAKGCTHVESAFGSGTRRAVRAR